MGVGGQGGQGTKGKDGGEKKDSGTSASSATKNNLLPSTTSVSVLYCTVGGSLGTIQSLTEKEYHFYWALQRAIVKAVLNNSSSKRSQSAALGGLSHSNFRNFENDTKFSEYRKFIDGDLIESFLDLTKRQMNEVVKILADDGWLSNYFEEGDSDEKNDFSDTSAKSKITVGGVIRQVEVMVRRH